MNHTTFEPKWFLPFLFCFFLLRGEVLAQIDSSNIKPYDIVISEFMAKPLANDKLPNSEFIELYNRTKSNIQLKNLRLYNGTKYSILPLFTLKANSYVIIYKKNKTISFSPFGDTLALDSLFTLSNPNDVFYLSTRSGKIIDAASYDLTLYRNSKKASGGVTLERTNVNSPCYLLGWDGSDSPIGGTPGKPNTVKLNIEYPLEVDRYYLKGDDRVGIVFNRSLDGVLAFQSKNYEMVPSIGFKVDSIVTPTYNEIFLQLNEKLKSNVDYKLLVKTTLKDCTDSSNLVKTDTLKIKVPEKIDTNLVVNELLFNPESGGSRFLELYNNSNKVFDIGNLVIGNKTADVTVEKSMLLFPKEYIAIADNPIYIQEHYNAATYRKRILKNKLPTWNETTDTVVLKVGTNKIPIDTFRYHKSWHNPLLANTEGVSLERVNPNRPANDSTNWQSAAKTVGYATPAQPNSQLHIDDLPTKNESIFTLVKKTFSPDDDGFDDFLRLNYRFKKDGYLASIYIFDDKGRRIKTLINNNLMNIEGAINWEGDNDEGLKAQLGIHIIVVEWVSPSGEVGREKHTCVVAGRL